MSWFVAFLQISLQWHKIIYWLEMTPSTIYASWMKRNCEQIHTYSVLQRAFCWHTVYTYIGKKLRINKNVCKVNAKYVILSTNMRSICKHILYVMIYILRILCEYFHWLEKFGKYSEISALICSNENEILKYLPFIRIYTEFI